MSNNKLSLDETIKQLDKRASKILINHVKLHLDNIERGTRMYEAHGNVKHLESVDNSKQTILNAFKELKGERL